MLKWIKRRSYIKNAMNDIQALTYLLGEHGRSLEKRQGVKQAIVKNFNQGTPASVAAVNVGGALLADAIERNIGQERKRAIAMDLTEWLESDDPSWSIQRNLTTRTPNQDRLLTCLQWALLRAMDMVSEGKIEPNDFEILKSEICGALLGTLQEQRSARRLAQRFRPLSDLALQ